MNYKHILAERREHAAWLTLNRPESMNALTAGMLTELGDALQRAESDDAVRVVVISGAGGAFCAGVDVKAIGAGGSGTAPLRAFMEIATPVFRRIETSRLPVIAAVQGVALAGGLELVLCCDLVIAAAGARLGDAHAKLGLVPGGGSSVRLTRRIGPVRARELLFTGDALPAGELQAMGLINRVVADDRLVEAAEELAGKLAARSPRGLACMKQMVANNDAMGYEACLRRESEMCIEHAASDDAREGFAAFAERRPPVFTGS